MRGWPAETNVALKTTPKALAAGVSAGPDCTASNTPHCSVDVGALLAEAATSAAQKPRQRMPLSRINVSRERESGASSSRHRRRNYRTNDARQWLGLRLVRYIAAGV